MTPFIVYLVFLGLALIVAIIALRVYKKALPEYRLMLIFICVLAGFELIRTFAAESVLQKAIDEVHYLLEVLLVALMMKRWQLFEQRPSIFPVLVGIILVCFGVEKLTGFIHIWSWCRILYALLIVLMSIELMNRTLLAAPEDISKNALYNFSRALVLYYFMVGIAETMMIILKDPPTGTVFYVYFYFGVAVSTITFLLYLKSVLCIPKKVTFSMP